MRFKLTLITLDAQPEIMFGYPYAISAWIYKLIAVKNYTLMVPLVYLGTGAVSRSHFYPIERGYEAYNLYRVDVIERVQALLFELGQIVALQYVIYKVIRLGFSRVFGCGEFFSSGWALLDFDLIFLSAIAIDLST
ncbi:MAG: hypothetical protein ABS46_02070 [Cytophagaceae bacterium SCN 52-12]|nr:MAG: hypothetical protein ABS46_02070 [Cytophagaceae bacterium SCN 52-12]